MTYPPPNNGRRKPLWPWLVAGVLLLMFAGCVGAAKESEPSGAPSSSTTKTRALPTTTTDPTKSTVFVARVERATSWSVTVKVDNRSISLTLARVAATGTCSMEFNGALEARLTTLVPSGTMVTVVRDTSATANNEAYLHLAPAGQEATTAPYGRSVNEVLIADGVAAFKPALERKAGSPSETEQVAQLRSGTPPEALAYFEALSSADITAWNIGAGVVPECRARLDRERSDRQRWWGPDEKAGTDDDPKPSIGNGNSNGSGSGGHGGGGFCRRSRWC